MLAVVGCIECSLDICDMRLHPLALIHPCLQPADPPSARPTLTGRKACVRLNAIWFLYRTCYIGYVHIHITGTLTIYPVLFVMGTSLFHFIESEKVKQLRMRWRKTIK